LETCGSTCCTEDSIPAPLPGHSECCDGACCAGTCYGEELCCATNNLDGGLPPLEHICASTDGTQCCGADQLCCQFDGCCDTICWGGDEFCCPEEAFCRGGGEVADVCCVNVGSALFACCNGGTNSRVCYDTSVEGACCTDADCGDPCLVCNPETNICGPRCDTETQLCCTEQAGPGVCVTGVCCPGGPECGAGQNCCVEDEVSYCTEAPCECDRICSDAGLDCCTIDNVFAWCYDQNAEGACCTVESCLTGQHCCSGTCSELECEQTTSCSSDYDCPGYAVCCVGDCCTQGQSCVNPENGNSYCE
jgi:hypothetical protein